MAASFFFYDLETSGLNPKTARIMQFAGQRVSLDLQPLGEPVDILIKLTPDILPDPDAVLLTGITPQATLERGITEFEFLKLFSETIAVPDTIFVGYNSVRFDDEFMRYLHYRNFYDAYRWQWCDGCSRWDLLDVVRMTRALRPDGIRWPTGGDGAASNRLEHLASLNGLDHKSAHNALSDVQATIAVAQLIREKQPKLFQFMLDMRQKQRVAALIRSGEPFLYTSGHYPSDYEKTTVAILLAECSDGQSAIVYDLREDPANLSSLTPKELVYRASWRSRMEGTPPLPVKVVKYNRCPAIAPLSVLDAASQSRLQLDLQAIEQHRAQLQANPELATMCKETFDKPPRSQQAQLMADELTVDERLYDGFFAAEDAQAMAVVRAAAAGDLSEKLVPFKDGRLSALLSLYKARNFPATLSAEERSRWEQFCSRRLMDGGDKGRLAQYMNRLHMLANLPRVTKKQQFLLEELRLYGELLMPAEAFAQ